MHPAKSVIFFTTGSGAGYGMLVWLAVLALIGQQPAETYYGLIAFGIAFGLVVGGLLSSTFHLGHPERAWRAMSQWRSSWLSREGIAAIVTFAPMGIFALGWVFLNDNQALGGAIGFIGAILCLVTVYCTSMIYGSLKSIPAWFTRWTPVAYLVFSLMTGIVLIWFLNVVFSMSSATLVGQMSLVFLLLGFAVKIIYWNAVDNAPATSTAESATGLAKLGKIRLIESPHSEDNYLLKEMGFQIARKHARKLRIIALILGFIAPFVLIALALYVFPDQVLMIAIATVFFATIGIVTERWLFFAEAKHVVTLFYGESRI
jgi:DMSO reductase anchor subunit